jgi:hypothetical protein
VILAGSRSMCTSSSVARSSLGDTRGLNSAVESIRL